MLKWIGRISGAQNEELPAALWSFAYFFCLLAGYYVLRPLRDEMAIQVGQKYLNDLFLYAFFAMLAIIPIFGWLNKTFPRRAMLPWLYAFFAANLLVFYFWMGTPNALLPRTFFVWVLVFNLFAVSVFWSFMADLFTTEQAKRLYGFIAAGGTAGALTGPALTAALVKTIGTQNLLLLALVFFLGCIGGIVGLRHWADAYQTKPAVPAAQKTESEERPSSIWAGLIDVAHSKYLLGICLFLFLYSLLSTLLYFQQTELLPKAVPDSKSRVQLLAQVDFAVNALTLGIQVLAFRALIGKLGIVALLVAMPVVSILGFSALALEPTLLTLVIFGVARRAGEYAVSKPARETLFNVLPAAQKYTAKNIIDTAVHRGGDMLSSQIFAGIKGFGLTLAQMAWLAVPIATVWALGAWALGREARTRESANQAAHVQSQN